MKAKKIDISEVSEFYHTVEWKDATEKIKEGWLPMGYLQSKVRTQGWEQQGPCYILVKVKEPTEINQLLTKIRSSKKKPSLKMIENTILEVRKNQRISPRIISQKRKR